MYQGKYGHLPWRTRLALWSQFGFYQLVFAILTPSVTFSFGLIFGFAIRLALKVLIFFVIMALCLWLMRWLVNLFAG